jgi:hypothetical protein
MMGGSGRTKKISSFEDASPGLRTDTARIPTLAIKTAGTSVLNSEDEMNVDSSCVLSNVTLAPLLRLAPLIESVKLGPPARMLVGNSEVKTVAAGITSNES